MWVTTRAEAPRLPSNHRFAVPQEVQTPEQTGSLRYGGTGEMRPGPRASRVLSCCGSGAGPVGATGVKPPREAAADHSRVRFLCVVPEGHPRIAQRLSVGALGGAPSHPGGNALDRQRRVRISRNYSRRVAAKIDHLRSGAGYGGLTDYGHAKPAEAGAPERRL